MSRASELDLSAETHGEADNNRTDADASADILSI
jgi:hypothetical protein